MTNLVRGDVVEVECFCEGRNPGCVKCAGEGIQIKKACRRCGGTGKEGAKCPDCRGQGYRDIDNSNFDNDLPLEGIY